MPSSYSCREGTFSGSFDLKSEGSTVWWRNLLLRLLLSLRLRPRDEICLRICRMPEAAFSFDVTCEPESESNCLAEDQAVPAYYCWCFLLSFFGVKTNYPRSEDDGLFLLVRLPRVTLASCSLPFVDFDIWPIWLPLVFGVVDLFIWDPCPSICTFILLDISQIYQFLQISFKYWWF